MSTKFPGGLITKSPVTPAGPYQTGAAPGVWTVEQALQYTKQGIWPIAGNSPPYIEDVFSTYLYTGNNTGQVIENGINLSSSNSSGSAYFDGTGDSLTVASNAALAFGTGDFTIECWVYSFNVALGNGIYDGRGGSATPAIVLRSTGVFEYYTNSAFQITSSAVLRNTWYHLVVCRSGTSTKMFVNGTQAGSTYSDSTNYVSTTPSYIGSLSDGTSTNGFISNFRIVKGTAVYTSNFTPPTAPLTAISGTSLLICQGPSPFVDNSTNGFTVTVNGNTASKSFGPFTSSTAGKGGLVWLKNRSVGTGIGHELYNTTVGAGNFLSSNNTNANTSTTSGSTTYGLASFNSNGFTLGENWNGENTSTQNIVSWTFAEQPKFFDIVTWTGDGIAGRQIPHNLGSVPGCIIVKRTSLAIDWYVYHRSLGATQSIFLNTTAAAGIDPSWNDTTPTASAFSVYSSNSTNGSGSTYVAYLFAHDAGGFGATGTDNVISCGSFTTDGSGYIPTVNLGYEPQWVLAKPSNGTGNWFIMDNMRGWYNQQADQGNALFPNTSGAEAVGYNAMIPTATGFTGPAVNFGAGITYIYIAIRRGPMKTPTVGTSVFTPIVRTGTGADATVSGVGFSPDWVWARPSASSSYDNLETDKLRGTSRQLATYSTMAELSNNTRITGWTNDGFTLGPESQYNASGLSIINWCIKRAPSVFDVVCYTGTGSATTQTHNLGVAPELIIVKMRNNYDDWYVYSNALSLTEFLVLDTDQGKTSGALWNTAPTSSVFGLSSAGNVNASGYTYVAYLFATCPGVSKVGSYSGTGATQTIDCGFTAGARFVLIKRTNNTGSWYVWDTARGMVSGTDPRLALNLTSAESNANWVYSTSNGFQIVTSDTNVNSATGTYIYLAIA